MLEHDAGRKRKSIGCTYNRKTLSMRLGTVFYVEMRFGMIILCTFPKEES